MSSIFIGNAAGTVKTPTEFKELLRSAATAVTIGSITMDPRPGNSGETYYHHGPERWSLNSLGMPNQGAEKLADWLPELRDLASEARAELRVSVAGFNPQEYAELADICLRGGADDVELNLGCPNVWGSDGKQKPIPSYQPELVAEILARVRKVTPEKSNVSVKISPVEEFHKLCLLAKCISQSGIVSRVVAVNTLPNQDREREKGGPALSFNGGNRLGGLSGRPLKRHGIRVVTVLRGTLPSHVKIIGVGGIFDGRDVLDYLEAGASGVMLGTAFLEYGTRIFSNVLQEFAELPGASEYFEGSDR